MTAETASPRIAKIFVSMLNAKNRIDVFIYFMIFFFTGENGQTITKHVQPLCRKKKIGKSKMDE